MLLPSSLSAGQTAVLAYDPSYVEGDPTFLVLVVEVEAEGALVASVGGVECAEWSVSDAEARNGLVAVRP